MGETTGEVPQPVEWTPDSALGLMGQILHNGVAAYNPAFDITSSRLISCIITESGVLRPEKIGKVAD